MRVLRVLFGLVLGLVLAAGLLRGLSAASNILVEAVRLGDTNDLRIGGLWLAGMGAALAVIMMIGRSDPAITVVCALGVVVPVGPALANYDLPTWAPKWLIPDHFVVLSPVYPLVAGALVVAAAWAIGDAARTGGSLDEADLPDEAAQPWDTQR